MNNEIDYKNSPLHGLSLKNLLIEIVDHYGFEILFAYLNINCFKTNPSIASSVKFLKKTTWACEKVEAFYLYEFKNLPKVSSEQFSLSPRDRIIPEGQTPGEPAELSLGNAEKLREKRVTKAAAYNQGRHADNRNNNHYAKSEHELLGSADSSAEEHEDPWAKWR
ncbi:MAG TPA: DNA-binding protein VF530 [Cycloclasticus sp.]|jgi:uncharacterized protein (DUF2132 family)|nr:DNA-binding protein VF530 [Cycloclasticus sp.]HIL93754.1 DNA-binding protein VF530 [Cycloclasticus sp.]